MAERGEPLSDRELDVLRRLAAGESNKLIADGLSISPHTVKTHLRNIYAKLGVSTRTEALTVGLQQGLLSVEAIASGAVAEDEDEATADEATDDDAAAKEDSAGEHIEAIAGGEATETAQTVGATHTAGASRWRTLSIALLAVLILAAGAYLLVRWRDNAAGAAGTTDPPNATAETPAELFTELPLGETHWTGSRPMPDPHAGRAAAAVGLDVYILSGEAAGGVTNRVQVFDTAGRTWRRVTNKPTAVSQATAAELFGEIYVPGGRLDDGRPTDIVEAYSPSQNAWRRVAPLPQPLAGALAVADGGFLYVLGGRDESGVQSAAYVYDPAADSWRPLAPLPAPRADATGGALTGRLYVVGGSDGPARQDSCFAYNPPADAWEECPAMLQARAEAGATVLLNKLYVIGGTPAGPDAADYGEIYDPNSRTWTVLNAPPGVNAWTDPGVVHVEMRIYAVGGRQDGTLSDAVLIYSPLAYQSYIPAAPGDSEE